MSGTSAVILLAVRRIAGYVAPAPSGGGSGNATSIQGRAVSATAPLVDQFLGSTNGTSWGPLSITQDMILTGAATTLAKVGGTALLEIGATITSPSFTSAPTSGGSPATPSSAIVTDTDGNAPQNVTSTPTAWTSSYNYSKSVNAQFVTWTVTDIINGVTKTASVTQFWGTMVRWGLSTDDDATIAALDLAGQRALITSLGSGSGGATQIATGRTRSLSFTVPGAGYRPLVSNPVSHGTPVFKDPNGFVISATKVLSAVDYINAQGVHDPTDVWILTGFTSAAGTLNFTES